MHRDGLPSPAEYCVSTHCTHVSTRSTPCEHSQYCTRCCQSSKRDGVSSPAAAYTHRRARAYGHPPALRQAHAHAQDAQPHPQHASPRTRAHFRRRLSRCGHCQPRTYLNATNSLGGCTSLQGYCEYSQQGYSEHSEQGYSEYSEQGYSE
jgi:hypothetical protein